MYIKNNTLDLFFASLSYQLTTTTTLCFTSLTTTTTVCKEIILDGRRDEQFCSLKRLTKSPPVQAISSYREIQRTPLRFFFNQGDLFFFGAIIKYVNSTNSDLNLLII